MDSRNLSADIAAFGGVEIKSWAEYILLFKLEKLEDQREDFKNH